MSSACSLLKLGDFVTSAGLRVDRPDRDIIDLFAFAHILKSVSAIRNNLIFSSIFFSVSFKKYRRGDGTHSVTQISQHTLALCVYYPRYIPILSNRRPLLSTCVGVSLWSN